MRVKDVIVNLKNDIKLPEIFGVSVERAKFLYKHIQRAFEDAQVEEKDEERGVIAIHIDVVKVVDIMDNTIGEMTDAEARFFTAMYMDKYNEEKEEARESVERMRKHRTSDLAASLLLAALAGKLGKDKPADEDTNTFSEETKG